MAGSKAPTAADISSLLTAAGYRECDPEPGNPASGYRIDTLPNQIAVSFWTATHTESAQRQRREVHFYADAITAAGYAVRHLSAVNVLIVTALGD